MMIELIKKQKYLCAFRKKLRFVKGLVYQMPLFQLVTLVLISMLEGAGLLRRTVIALINFSSFIFKITNL